MPISFSAAVENTKTLGEAAKAMGNVIRNEIKMWIAEAIAGAVKNALISVPFPLNVILAGAAAAATTVAFNALIPEFAKGQYPSFQGKAKTGIYNKPSMFIAAEKEPELIVSGPHTRYLQMNHPALINAIYATRDMVPQYASGNYLQPQASPSPSGEGRGEVDLAGMVSKTSKLLQFIIDNGIYSTTNINDKHIEEIDKRRDLITTIKSKSNRYQ